MDERPDNLYNNRIGKGLHKNSSLQSLKVLSRYSDQIKLRLQVNLMLVGDPNDKASHENRAREGYNNPSLAKTLRSKK